MKKLIVLVIVVLAVWLAVNYVRTGTLSLFPAAATAAEQEKRDLEAELSAIDAKIESAGRAAGLSGVDTTADVAALRVRREQIEKRLESLRAQH
jgi:peptidoglycan hydrolase CwlO-like protein